MVSASTLRLPSTVIASTDWAPAGANNGHVTGVPGIEKPDSTIAATKLRHVFIPHLANKNPVVTGW
ncbi:hypothetical protein ABIF15_000539 [Bradyrhizobium elkanii]